MRITRNNCDKLRSGQTVFRCLIWFGLTPKVGRDLNRPRVEVETIQLRGSKIIDAGFPGRVYRIGAKDWSIGCTNFLHDVACGCYTSTSRRAALRFKKEVEELGMHRERVEARFHDLTSDY